MSLLSRIKFYLKHKIYFLRPKDPFHIDKKCFKKYLPKNAIIIDCGAHIGLDSIELSKIYPQATIHSFEPIPEIFTRLHENTKNFENIKCYRHALDDKDSQEKMFVSSNASDGSSSLLKPIEHLKDHPDVLFQKEIIVDVRSLDTWAVNNGVEKVDLLWLDMQGFEYQTLNASKKIFPSVKIVHTEVSLKETYEGVMQYQNFKVWMESKNFEVFKEAIPNGTDMGNVVFVRKKTIDSCLKKEK